jgi:hypothetical protein
MSALVKAIQAVRTGQRIPIYEHAPVFVDADVAPNHVGGVDGQVYRVGVRADCRAILTRESDLPHLVDEAKRNIIEHVFGEFRGDFRRVHQALWERDIDQARERLAEMERRMFGGA